MLLKGPLVQDGPPKRESSCPNVSSGGGRVFLSTRLSVGAMSRGREVSAGVVMPRES